MHQCRSHITEHDIELFKVFLRKGTVGTAKKFNISPQTVHATIGWVYQYYGVRYKDVNKPISVLNILLKNKILKIEEL